ncbi:MAG TPA: 4-hydroxyphenylacetate 3-hydroxylase N-terminal domain-containing protein [Nitriliruptoraceae bacterium]|nr:4-hydroxyphenylacetate 3-hydroxylase N-terminal domain-containing protein [Nitriliruptoraceae bacterium]
MTSSTAQDRPPTAEPSLPPDSSSAPQPSSPDRTPTSADDLWAAMPTVTSGGDYVDSLRNRGTRLFLMGELVEEPADHPMITPSINAMRATYDLVDTEPDLALAHSPYTDGPVNRFLHVTTSSEDLVAKHRMQRRLGQATGTCFQRCVGMDAVATLHSVTHDLDAAHDTHYQDRFITFLTRLQRHNLVLAGGMTDPKGDRSLPPRAQVNQDVFLRVVDRDDNGVWVSGAKAHMTGGWNSHWVVVMPTMHLTAADADCAIVGAIPITAPGITYVYGRQASDGRSLEPGTIDQGNARFGGQEVLVHFDRVFIPHEHVFMDGEVDMARTLVQRFTRYHRSSYMCKTGLGDVLIGAAAEVADANGVPGASHINDKLVEMTHLNETIWSSGIAGAAEAEVLPSGAAINDGMLSNVAKHNVTRFPYEIARLAQDIAGGLMVTMPSESDLRHDEVGPLIQRLLAGRDGVSTEDRLRIMRLIETMTIGRNAVGYLTESLHGAGSPQAQRIEIRRAMDVETKRAHARVLAGIVDEATADDEPSDH